MKIFLQAWNRWKDAAELDMDSGHVAWRSREGIPTGQFHGAAARLGDLDACLYRTGRELAFRVSEKVFALDSETVVELRRGTVNLLLVVRKGSPVFTWTYPAPVMDPSLEVDPTACVEEEDFDFGLFVSNVSKDPARKARLFA